MLILALSLAAAASTSTQPAHPRQSDPSPPSARVLYVDLDLNQPKGVRQLRRRVSWAVNSLCPDALRPFAFHAATARCRTEALASAEPQIEAAIAAAKARVAPGTSTLALNAGVREPAH